MKLVDPMDFSIDPFLSNMQGNILKGHGRDFTTHIFLHFGEGCEEQVKEWIGNISGEVTTFKKQLRDRELYKRNKLPGGLFTAFFLSAAGYKYLGFEDVEEQFSDQGFKKGMKGRLDINNDPLVSQWEKGFQQQIHAMLLLADDDRNRMANKAREILDNLSDLQASVAIEYGSIIRNANKDGIEHFGYVDGISQPLFLKEEVDEWMKFHNVDPSAPVGHPARPKFDPTADTSLVLVKDPYSTVPESFGSYFVFRKLEQNVKGFKEAEEALDLGELGGAYLVGRFEDGSPVVLTNDEGVIGAGSHNNFNYDKDPSGGRCPHFAHTRKTNPREDLLPGDDHKSHIMARRGIPYGIRAVDTALDQCDMQLPEGGVGLLFMSYQQSIEHQFEFFQSKMANDPAFPAGTNTGVDAIIGQVAGQNPAIHAYKFPSTYGTNQRTAPLTFSQFVSMKGGEYFFTPSIAFLQSFQKKERPCRTAQNSPRNLPKKFVLHDLVLPVNVFTSCILQRFNPQILPNY